MVQQFEEVPLYSCIVWLGNTKTPVRNFENSGQHSYHYNLLNGHVPKKMCLFTSIGFVFHTVGWLKSRGSCIVDVLCYFQKFYASFGWCHWASLHNQKSNSSNMLEIFQLVFSYVLIYFSLSGYFQGLAFWGLLGGGRSCNTLWRRVWMLLEIWVMWC